MKNVKLYIKANSVLTCREAIYVATMDASYAPMQHVEEFVGRAEADMTWWRVGEHVRRAAMGVT